jgi:integrase
MRPDKDKPGTFQKVAECLYRYTSNGVYYARIKANCKEIRRSLGTTDRAHAMRELRVFKEQQSQIDRSKSRMTLAELCDIYLRTIQHQKLRTVQRKTLICSRIKSDWPTGSQIQIGKIKPSDVSLWLSGYDFGAASRNLHLECIKAILAMAVADRLIASSPAAGIKSMKRETPIRRTPTFEQFQRIVESIRSQRFNVNGHCEDESADFVEFCGLAGLGQAEAASLEWSDVDWQRETITTFRHKTTSGFVIPLYPQLRPLLERRHAQRSPGEDRVFRIANAKRAIEAACRRLKFPAFGHRSLRRMFITRAIERGVDVKVLAQWQGHKDGGKLILETYSHVNPVHSKRMAALMTAEPVQGVAMLQRAG